MYCIMTNMDPQLLHFLSWPKTKDMLEIYMNLKNFVKTFKKPFYKSLVYPIMLRNSLRLNSTSGSEAQELGFGPLNWP